MKQQKKNIVETNIDLLLQNIFCLKTKFLKQLVQNTLEGIVIVHFISII